MYVSFYKTVIVHQNEAISHNVMTLHNSKEMEQQSSSQRDITSYDVTSRRNDQIWTVDREQST